MSKIIVFTNLSLDGVMQAPAQPDEDTRDGFKHGGWATPYGAMQQAGNALANMGSLLFGRRTYENFYEVWPKRTDSPFADFFNNIQKYVASTTLAEPLPWINSTLVKDVDAVAALKAEQEKDVVIFGSGVLVQSLMQNNLVDEYVLFIHPLILGSGRRLFPSDGAFAALSLIESRATDNGVLIATYRPAN